MSWRRTTHMRRWGDGGGRTSATTRPSLRTRTQPPTAPHRPHHPIAPDAATAPLLRCANGDTFSHVPDRPVTFAHALSPSEPASTRFAAVPHFSMSGETQPPTPTSAEPAVANETAVPVTDATSPSTALATTASGPVAAAPHHGLLWIAERSLLDFDHLRRVVNLAAAEDRSEVILRMMFPRDFPERFAGDELPWQQFCQMLAVDCGDVIRAVDGRYEFVRDLLRGLVSRLVHTVVEYPTHQLNAASDLLLYILSITLLEVLPDRERELAVREILYGLDEATRRTVVDEPFTVFGLLTQGQQIALVNLRRLAGRDQRSAGEQAQLIRQAEQQVTTQHQVAFLRGLDAGTVRNRWSTVAAAVRHVSTLAATDAVPALAALLDLLPESAHWWQIRRRQRRALVMAAIDTLRTARAQEERQAKAAAQRAVGKAAPRVRRTPFAPSPNPLQLAAPNTVMEYGTGDFIGMVKVAGMTGFTSRGVDGSLHVVAIAPFYCDPHVVTNEAFDAHCGRYATRPFAVFGQIDGRYSVLVGGFRNENDAEAWIRQNRSEHRFHAYAMQVERIVPVATQRRLPQSHGAPNQPVVKVTLWEALFFAFSAGKRLLTLAEWQYLATAGGNNQFGTRSGELRADEMAIGTKRPLSVATAPANPLGIHDLVGPVYELTAELDGDRLPVVVGNAYHINPDSDPLNECDDAIAVDQTVPDIRDVTDRRWHPAQRSKFIGFRCAADIPAEPHMPDCPPPPAGNMP
ncbi:MAG: SUMF1/EgtB/PvdO family nonheme iron enzyme [Deltaproteobacteria bacterium]|nr:SUMF1/EgtB/PvdO family nonheme iron enzyme [Deltaproteobacteria bacterium]